MEGSGLAKLTIGLAKYGSKVYGLTVTIEDEIGPRMPSNGFDLGTEHQMDLGTFYNKFIRPGRGIASVVGRADSPSARAKLNYLLSAIERDQHVAKRTSRFANIGNPSILAQAIARKDSDLTQKTAPAHGTVASPDDIRRIIANLDDEKLLDITALQPTVRDVEEASLWLAGDTDVFALGNPLAR